MPPNSTKLNLPTAQNPSTYLKFDHNPRVTLPQPTNPHTNFQTPAMSTPDDNSKRKACEQPSSHVQANKKPKTPYLSDEDFRVESSWSMVQPIGMTNAQVPLTSAEAFRLKGWYWRYDGMKADDTKTMSSCDKPECESPKGTKFW